jgi:hypothetical protein
LRSILVTYLKVEEEARWQAVQRGASTYKFNKTLRTTRKLLQECERALEEAGWLRSDLSSER